MTNKYTIIGKKALIRQKKGKIFAFVQEKTAKSGLKIDFVRLLAIDNTNSVCGDAFAATRKAELFFCGGFYIDVAKRYAKRDRHVFAHFLYKRESFGFCAITVASILETASPWEASISPHFARIIRLEMPFMLWSLSGKW